jgi:hypothetical protein
MSSVMAASAASPDRKYVKGQSRTGNISTRVPLPVVNLVVPQGRLVQRRCACGGSCPNCGNKELGFQSNIKIGPENGQFEKEADQVSEKVMSIGDTSVSRPNTVPEVNDSDSGNRSVQLKPQSAGGLTTLGIATTAPQIGNLKGNGESLESGTRTFFEPRFGYDFSQVRIHNDHSAADAAHAVRARAFTFGNHIVFNRGQYQPSNYQGRELLAHELTHVIQQRSNTLQRQVEAEATEEVEHNFINCNEDATQRSDAVAIIQSAIRLARVMVADALAIIDTDEGEELLRPEFCRVGAATCPNPRQRRQIRNNLNRIASWLNSSRRFVCINHDRPACERFSAAVRCGQPSVMLCSGFFQGSGPCNARTVAEGRAAILIHEAAHLVGIPPCSGEDSESGTERYCHDRQSGLYPPRNAISQSADSYSEYATNAYHLGAQERFDRANTVEETDLDRLRSRFPGALDFE